MWKKVDGVKLLPDEGAFTTLDISDEQSEVIDRFAEKTGLSRNDAINRIMKMGLRRLGKEGDKNQKTLDTKFGEG